MTLRSRILVFVWVVIITATIGTRALLYQELAGFHEYEAVFVYLSDFVLLGLIWWIYTKRTTLHSRPLGRGLGFFLAFFIAASALSVTVAPSPLLAIFSFTHLLIAVVCAYLLSKLVSTHQLFTGVLTVLVCVTVAQAALGVYQFSAQRSLGLYRLGEPELVAPAGSTSTIRAEGGRFVRAYGTLPHPNVLGGWLAIGLIAASGLYIALDGSLYTYNKKLSIGRNFKYFIFHPNLYKRLLLSAGMFILILGITVTFSRSAWMATSLGLAILVAAALSRSVKLFAVTRTITILIACAATVYMIIAPLVATRTHVSATEQAVDYRLSYAAIGTKIALTQPLGVGIGNQVLFSVTEKLYQERGMTKLWQWEPVHNLYILMASEIGLFGLLSFLAFLAIVMWRLVRNSSLEAAVGLSLLSAVAVLGLFDHFLWDLQPGRLLLWLVIGLVLSSLFLEKRLRP